MNSNLANEEVIIPSNIEIAVIPRKVDDNKPKKHITYNIIKRIVDILGGIVGVILLIPITLL